MILKKERKKMNKADNAAKLRTNYGLDCCVSCCPRQQTVIEFNFFLYRTKCFDQSSQWYSIVNTLYIITNIYYITLLYSIVYISSKVHDCKFNFFQIIP